MFELHTNCPYYVVELHRDSCSRCFGLAWYRVVVSSDREASLQVEGKEPAFRRPCNNEDGGTARYPYYYSMNGGLLYRGPGAGETFSVQLTSDPKKFWSINT